MPADVTALPSSGLDEIIAKVVAHTPDWLRRELASPDTRSREQAEEALAAMLSAALHKAAARDR